MTTAPPPRRSHTGCWTCKRRRRKCDEGHPACRTCSDAGLDCEGYEQRLRWGTGVASRGHLAGAQEPIQGSTPRRQKGRRRDLDKQKRQQPIEMVSPSTSPPNASGTPSLFSSGLSAPSVNISDIELRDLFDQDVRRKSLFDEFLKTGHLFLFSIPANDSPVISMIPQLCKQSETLYNIVASLQAYLDHGKNGAFFEYYDMALAQFRADLDSPVQQSGDAILMSALLLCTIGILQGTPWTVHLKGMENLLKARSQLSPRPSPSSYSIHTMEVMGWMDLPTFVIGRQTQSMGIWRQFRAGKIISFSKGPDAIEPVSGLPRSLIDLFSYDGDLSTEEAFVLWPGFEGNIAQCHMWEAYRLAGILDIRRRRAEGVPLVWGASPLEYHPAIHLAPQVLPENAVLVSRIASSVDALSQGAKLSSSPDALLATSVLYPLFVLALEAMGTEAYKGLHDLIAEWFQWQISLNHSATTKLAWEIIQEIAFAKQEGVLFSPDDLAREKGIEVALF